MDPTRWTTLGWRSVNGDAAHQAMPTTTMATANTQNPTQLSSLRPANMWLRLLSRPVVNTIVTCMAMKTRNQTITRKCRDRANWMESTLLMRRNRVDSAGDIPSPLTSANGAATNTVTK